MNGNEYKINKINGRLCCCNNEILKKSLILTSCAALVVASSFGAIKVHNAMVEYINSGHELTLQSGYQAEWYRSMLVLACMSGIVGGVFAKINIKKIAGDIKEKK